MPDGHSIRVRRNRARGPRRTSLNGLGVSEPPGHVVGQLALSRLK